MLEISGNTATAVSDSGLPLALSSVWFIPGWKYFMGGDGLYSTNAIGNSWESDTVNNPSQDTFSIRRAAEDDIFMVGGIRACISLEWRDAEAVNIARLVLRELLLGRFQREHSCSGRNKTGAND